MQISAIFDEEGRDFVLNEVARSLFERPRFTGRMFVSHEGTRVCMVPVSPGLAKVFVRVPPAFPLQPAPFGGEPLYVGNVPYEVGQNVTSANADGFTPVDWVRGVGSLSRGEVEELRHWGVHACRSLAYDVREFDEWGTEPLRRFYALCEVMNPEGMEE